MKQVLVIAGRTASGKDTVASILRETFGYHKAITSTSRPPRPYEVNGEHYHFFEESEFKECIELGRFIEYENNKGNFYGCSFDAILNTPNNKPTVIILDPAGAMNLREFLVEQDIECKVLYINELVETCIERVKSRDADESEIERSIDSLCGKEMSWNLYKYDFATKRGATIEENIAYARSVFEGALDLDATNSKNTASALEI